MEFLTREITGAPTITLDVIALLHNINASKAQIIKYTPIIKKREVLQEIGDKMIDRMLKRTLANKDKDGVPFKGYSASYKNSKVFKIYGKSNQVNLKLRGYMHADLGVIRATSNNVTIGFTDWKEAEKAKGHITGANYLPRRDFFGFKKRELKQIVLDTIKDYEYLADEIQYDLILKEAPIKFETEGSQSLDLWEDIDFGG